LANHLVFLKEESTVKKRLLGIAGLVGIAVLVLVVGLVLQAQVSEEIGVCSVSAGAEDTTYTYYQEGSGSGATEITSSSWVTFTDMAEWQGLSEGNWLFLVNMRAYTEGDESVYGSLYVDGVSYGSVHTRMDDMGANDKQWDMVSRSFLVTVPSEECHEVVLKFKNGGDSGSGYVYLDAATNWRAIRIDGSTSAPPCR
jgi:hypothetical protein